MISKDFHPGSKSQLQNVSKPLIIPTVVLQWVRQNISIMYFSLYCVSIPFLYQEYVRTSLYDGRLVAWANREHLEHSACGPQQFLICEGPHDVDQGLGTTAGQNDQLKKIKGLC